MSQGGRRFPWHDGDGSGIGKRGRQPFFPGPQSVKQSPGGPVLVVGGAGGEAGHPLDRSPAGSGLAGVNDLQQGGADAVGEKPNTDGGVAGVLVVLDIGGPTLPRQPVTIQVKLGHWHVQLENPFVHPFRPFLKHPSVRRGAGPMAGAFGAGCPRDGGR